MSDQRPQSLRLPGPPSTKRAKTGIILMVLCFTPASLAAASMKLVAPNVGWAAYDNRLYWTNNNGVDWEDITPVPTDIRRAAVTLRLPFFRDKSEGWAIIKYRQQSALAAATIGYTVAHTLDSGSSWSFTELTYPELPEWIQEIFAGPGNLFFADSLHGWLDIGFAGNSKPGKLLATVDGGKTWNWVNSSGFSGPITFATLQDGWQLGYFGADKLYVTHDGCNTWQEVTLPVPRQIGVGAYRKFQGTPIFQDHDIGNLVVEYSEAGGGPSKLVVYSTSDTGRTWQPAKVLDRSPEAMAGGGPGQGPLRSAMPAGRPSTPPNGFVRSPRDQAPKSPDKLHGPLNGTSCR